MEIIKKSENGDKGLRTLQKCMAAMLFVMVLAGCGKDDVPADSITVKTATSSFEAVNTCALSSGANGTNFQFTIPYTKTGKTEISIITVNLEWPTAQPSSSVASNFTDNGTSITYNRCYRFADQDWVDITHYLVLEGGNGSNPTTIRVNRPEGAN